MNSKFCIVTAVMLSVAAMIQAETFEELNTAISKAGAEQIELQGTTKDLSEKLDREFNSGKHDTPEMKANRAKIAKLQAELAATEGELRKQFRELPQFSEDFKKLDANISTLTELDTKRKELLKKRSSFTVPAK